MILSNTEIHKAIDEGRLLIDPEPLPRRPAVGQACPYDAHTVDLKLHNELFVPRGGKFNIDLSNPGPLTDVLSQHTEKFIITDEQPFSLKPGMFILAQTIEKIGLPIKEDGEITLAARIEGKSSRARFGLIIHCTAPTIHPGFCGQLALEVANLGPATFTLSPGMHIAQLVIEEVRGIIIPNPSAFQGQVEPTGKKSM